MKPFRRRSKRAVADGSRYYGDGNTLHGTGWLDVETHHGTVVAVWFRCQALPFQQAEVDGQRATDMEELSRDSAVRGSRITGVRIGGSG